MVSPLPHAPEVSLSAAIVDGSPIATFVLDSEHRVTHWNRACEVLTGIGRTDRMGKTDTWRAFYDEPRPVLADLILAFDEQALSQHYARRFKPATLIPGAIEAEDFFPAMGKTGKWLSFTASPLYDAQGVLCGAIETLQDITEQRLAEAAFREGRNFLAQIVDGSSVAMFVIDQDHHVTHWNRACETLTGMSARSVLGTREQWRAFYDHARPVMADIVLDGARYSEIDTHYRGKYRRSDLIPGGFEAEDFFPAFGDNGRWVFFTAAPIHNAQGQLVGAVETLQDVSARKAAEIALRKSEERYRVISQLDNLTQLFNSRHFHDQLAREIERSQRYGRALSMMMIDADHFKRVNDNHGHQMGDHVLQELARTLRDSLRNSDSGFRYGGEEFIALMPETAITTATVVAERMRQRVEALAITVGEEQVLHCTVSIGISELLPADTAATFLQRADQAAYRAKARGRNCVECG